MGEHVPVEPNKVPEMTIEQARNGEPAGPGDGSEARLDSVVQRFIGDQLRAVYDEVAQEPVPERFVKLLEELERQRADHS